LKLDLNRQVSFALSEDPFDTDSKYTTTIPITVSEFVLPDIYPIAIKIVYGDGGEAKETSVDLAVENCITTHPVTTTIPPEPEEEEIDDTIDTIITPP